MRRILGLAWVLGVVACSSSGSAPDLEETVDELVSLIVAQRNYEVNSRAIRVSDEMLAQVTQLVQ